ncbi:MAG: hypothetical protein KF757_08500 [Phycisphaeraceae bacterium]|nr:hypothetical protein [Phycisphaeraceae bacterium]MCW5762794.1 hypothetical protein [Phycisphaeraceae bacterium]
MKTREWLAADVRRMKASPIALQRPILVLAGWRSPRTLAYVLMRRLRSLTGAPPESFAWLSYPYGSDIMPLADRAVLLAKSRLSPNGEQVDVVAVSMGGLVARTAALPDREHRLNIARLFTLGTPHRGARLAEFVRIDAASRCMMPGSEFLAKLDAALEHADFELFPYAATGDWLVGATNTSPPGVDPIWFDGPPLLAHQLITHHMGIIVDIARRLRGEDPIAHASPVPRD